MIAYINDSNICSPFILFSNTTNIQIIIRMISQNNGHKKLAQLSSHIRNWNILGQSLLPELELVFLIDLGHEEAMMSILEDCKAQKIQIIDHLPQQSQNQNTTLTPTKLFNNSQIYQLYKMRSQIKGNIHLIRSLSDTKIADADFKRRKQYIDRFTRKKDSIFIAFDQQQYRLLKRSQNCLSQFGLTNSTNKFIMYGLDSSKYQLYNVIVLKYEEIFKFELVRNYTAMKDARKTIEKDLGRYLEWKKILDHQIKPESYALYKFKSYTETMKSSFSGTYSSDIHFENFGYGKSINWKISEMLAGFWEIESDMLFKSVEKMSLKYIEQEYKMSDYYSIGGFLPDTCFKQIFSPPLYTFQCSLQKIMKSIMGQVLHHIQSAITHTFKNTTIVETFIDQQIAQIQQTICNSFQKQFQHSLKSQIEYIYATPDQFWDYRQLNSGLYSPDQQVYIQIKYIGKAYVRRVFQRIRENVPRMIGQNLLKQITNYLNNGSFQTFLRVLRERQFNVVIPEEQLRQYRKKDSKKIQLERLINYFSLKVSSPIFIKNFHEKRKRDWERMFGTNQLVSQQPQISEQRNEGGFMNWMRKIFAKQQNPKRLQRSNSLNNNHHRDHEQSEKEKDNKKFVRKGLNQKQWLLVINTDKQVPNNKIIESSLEGFPSRMRASIWLHLAYKSRMYEEHVKLSKILENQVNQGIRRQIQKDVQRTPPSNIFRYSLRQSLTRVLQGYSIYDRQLGYTQGMNFITSILLLTLSNYQQKSVYSDNLTNHQQIEQKAFILLKYLMKEKGVSKMMSVSAELISEISLRLQARIKQLSPQAFDCIQQTPFTCQMIFSSPIISCLTGLKVDFLVQKRFMDLLITHDIYIVYKIIAQFVAASESILLKLDLDSIYNYLRMNIYEDVYGMVGEQGLTMMFQDL